MMCVHLIFFTDYPLGGVASVPKPSTDHCDYTKKRLTLIFEKTREWQNRLKMVERETEHAVKKPLEKSVGHSYVLVNQPQLTILSAPESAMLSKNDGSSFSMRSPRSQFKCPLCLHGYRSQTLLNDHMRKQHSVLI